MKTFRLLFIFLVLFSFQAGATGYVHNMFVAHKKLQSCKEVNVEKVTVKKAKPAVKVVKPAVQSKQGVAILNTSLTSKTADSVTLNERILEEGPAALFESGASDAADESVVTKLIGVLKSVIYAFLPLR